MFLRSLSLRGFKSFANKTILKFEPGITAIVGPNGSGKSNITDAALWVLGEQSARQLRGSTMQDVIFSGSTTRQSLGIAEVNLTLDNSDGLLPIEFTEVTIDRRCYRSGESEYYLNGSPCRLIDIQELLSDSGLGREMYSIISQGKLDDVLNCKPEERRRLIEEAAGVLKHKKRKERALRKLASMEDNLTRARDILKEINRQIAPLHKQANAAEIFVDLNDQLKSAEVAIAVIDLRSYQQQWEKFNNQLSENNLAVKGLRSKLEAEEAIISECEDKLETKGLVAGDIGEHRRRVESIQQQLNSGLLLLEEKGRNLVERLSELRQKIYQLERKKAGDSTSLNRMETEKASADQKLTKLYGELAELRKLSEQVKKESREADAAFEKNSRQLDKERQRLESAQMALAKSSSARSSSEEQMEFLRVQLDTTLNRIESLKNESSVIKESLSVISKERASLQAQIAKGQNQIDNLVEEVEKSKLECDEIASGQNKVVAKIAALKELLESLKPAAGAAPRLLDGEKRNAGLLGILGDLISVQAKYEKAIEAVLSQDIHSIVAKDTSTIFKAIKWMDETQDEFVSLVPVTGNQRQVDEGKPELIWAMPALKVIDCRKDIRPAVELLLNGVFIVDDLNGIIENQGKLPNGYVLVTLNGEILTERGVLRCGVFSTEGSLGTLACKRELAELREKEITMESVAATSLKHFRLLQAKLDGIRNTDLEKSKKIQSLDNQISQNSTKEKHLEDQKAILIDQKNELEEQIQKKLSELAMYSEEKGSQSAGADELKVMVGKIASKLEILRQDRERRLEREKETTHKLGKCQIEIASLTERQIHLKRQLINIETSLKEADDVLTSSMQIETALESLRARIEPVHHLYTGLRLKAENWADTLKNLAEKEIGETREIRERLRSTQEIARELADQINSRNQLDTDIQVKQAQLEMQVNSTIEHLVDELQVPIEKALETISAEAQCEPYERRIKQLKTKMAELGPVNPMAVKEYKELEDRQAFLSDQIEDLLKSRKALEKVVTAIDRKIHEKFAATFDKVKEHFQNVFEELFPGGRVSLILTEPDDLSEGGIEIEAQPHGKALQSLSLLSGGEKSLAGLALLFAIYYARPSPFYILDEVEAALDDVNLQRLINLLNKLKTRTQFLIITHQRRTMEIADSLYGVSMQADGVSKLISQKLSDGDRQEGRVRERETELAGTAEIRSGKIPN